MGHHDEGTARMGRMFESLSEDCTTNLYDEDARGWDMSVPRDAIIFDAEKRIRQMEGPDWLNDFLIQEAMCNSCHLCVIGNQLVEILWYGITASGIMSTSAQNSSIRTFLAIICGAIKGSSVGDDLVRQGEIDAVEFAKTGAIMKGVAKLCPPGGPIDMTSHRYTSIVKPDGSREWTGRFLNFDKLLAHLDLRRVEGKPPSPDAVGGALFAVRHSPEDTAVLLAYCRGLGWNTDVPMLDVDVE